MIFEFDKESCYLLKFLDVLAFAKRLSYLRHLF